MMITRDSELFTVEEITARIASIEDQIRRMDDLCPVASVILHEKRHAKYCKLVARADALRTRRARMLQGVQGG